MDMHMTNLAIGHSVTDTLFGAIMFMHKDNDMNMRFNSMMASATGQSGFTMKSSGIADTMLMGKYRLFTDDPLVPTRQASLLFGLSLPTGSIDERNGNHPLPCVRRNCCPTACNWVQAPSTRPSVYSMRQRPIDPAPSGQ